MAQYLVTEDEFLSVKVVDGKLQMTRDNGEIVVAGELLQGEPGPQGLPGVNAVPTDEAVATYATTPGSQTNTALNATIDAGVAPIHARVVGPRLHGFALSPSASRWASSPHAGPSAVFDADTNRTWIAFIGTGGHVFATYYDHATGSTAPAVLAAANPRSTPNFHCDVAVMLDNDGRMHIILGGHNDAHRHIRMLNPRDLTQWTVAALAEGTYPFAAKTADGTLVFVDRAGTTAHDGHNNDRDRSFPSHAWGTMWTWDAGGGSWSRAQIVDLTAHPALDVDFYPSDFTYAGGRKHLWWYIASGSKHDDVRQNAYYAYQPDGEANWYSADGTNLGPVITWAEHASCLIRAGDGSTRLAGAVRASTGRPATVQVIPGSASGYQLFVAQWDGGAWQSNTYDVRLPNGGATPALVERQGILHLFTATREAGQSRADLITLTSADGVTYTQSQTVLEKPGQSGTINVRAVVGGPLLATCVATPASSLDGSSPSELVALRAITQEAPAYPAQRMDGAETVWLDAAMFNGIQGSPSRANVGASGTQRLSLWGLDSSSFEAIATALYLPQHWRTARVSVVWANPTANAGDVMFTGDISHARIGQDFNAAARVNVSVTAAAGAQYVLVETILYPSLDLVGTQGGLLDALRMLRVGRNGAGAGDTLDSDASIVGLRLTRLA